MIPTGLGRSVRAAGAGLLLAALLLVTSFPASADESAARGQGRDDHLQRVAYFIQWGIYGRSYFVKNVATSGQAAHLTTINYAFGNVSQDGQCFDVNQAGQGDAWADFQRPVGADESVDGVADVDTQALAGNFNQLRTLTKQFPNLRVVM